jgi:signal transduction histidine kinase
MFLFKHIYGMAESSFWISAPCFAVIMLIILEKEWRRFKSHNPLDRYLFYMVFFILFNCLPFSLESLCVSHVIVDNDLFFSMEQLSKATGAVTFFFWLNFTLQYTEIKRPYSIILLSGAALLALSGLVFVAYSFLTVGHLSELRASSLVNTWVTVMMVSENAAFVGIALYALSSLFCQHRKHQKQSPRFKVTLVAMLMPLLLGLLYFFDDSTHSLALTTSCLIFYIYMVSYEREGLRHSKEMFLENMSHEIRTSLNSVYGFAQLLCMPEGTWSDKERQSYSTHIRNSYNMLDMLLNDLMVSTRLDTHKYSVKVATIDVLKVVTDGVDALSVCMPSSVNINLSSDLPSGYTIQSDGRRIRQIVQNLLTNVSQYIIKGQVVVHVSLKENMVQISVAASIPAAPGEGYKAAVAKSLSDHKTGLNLRLQICRRLAILLGGSVHRDRTYNNGIRYVVLLSNKCSGNSSGYIDPATPFTDDTAAVVSTQNYI